MSRPESPRRRRRGILIVASVVLGAGAVFAAAPSIAQLGTAKPAAAHARSESAARTTTARTSAGAHARHAIARATGNRPTARPAAVTKPSGAFRLYQLNMCMWGYHKSGPCFAPNTAETGNDKVIAVVSQMQTYHPDAVTLNEGCKGDVDKIVNGLRMQHLTYTYRYVPLGQGRQCEQGRGLAVNAIIAKGFTSSQEGGYFQKGGARAWMCSVVSGGVRVCTAHLSLPPPKQKPQAVECNILRSKVRKTGGHPTVFAGDTNINHTQNKNNCAPGDFWGLQDIETNGKLNGQSGMQQIYYSTNLSRRGTCGEMHTINWVKGFKPKKSGGLEPTATATDHKGYLLDLYKVSTPTRGADCTWRDLRPSGWSPVQKWLHGYVFHTEDHAGWTAPAATRLALTMQAQAPYQSTLNSQLGASPAPETVTRVLNDHLAADGAPRFYKTRLRPSAAQLRSDMHYDFIRGTAIVAQVKGTVKDTNGNAHTAKTPSYLIVAGYYQRGDRLTVENVAAARTNMKVRRYNLTLTEFHKWLAAGYSA